MFHRAPSVVAFRPITHGRAAVVAAAEKHSRLFPNQSHFGVGGREEERSERRERALLGQKEGKWGNGNAAATLLHSPPPHLTAKTALSPSLSLLRKLMTALGQWERQNLSPFDR